MENVKLTYQEKAKFNRIMEILGHYDRYEQLLSIRPRPEYNDIHVIIEIDRKKGDRITQINNKLAIVIEEYKVN